MFDFVLRLSRTLLSSVDFVELLSRSRSGRLLSGLRNERPKLSSNILKSEYRAGGGLQRGTLRLPRRSCSQRGAVRHPARSRYDTHQSRIEQRAHDKRESAHFDQFTRKTAVRSQEARTRSAALLSPSVSHGSVHTAQAPRKHPDAATGSPG